MVADVAKVLGTYYTPSREAFNQQVTSEPAIGMGERRQCDVAES
jgi:hypothetical protein